MQAQNLSLQRQPFDLGFSSSVYIFCCLTGCVLQDWNEDGYSQMLLKFMPELLSNQYLMLDLMHIIIQAIEVALAVSKFFADQDAPKGEQGEHDVRSIYAEVWIHVSILLRLYVSLAVPFAKVRFRQGMRRYEALAVQNENQFVCTQSQYALWCCKSS